MAAFITDAALLAAIAGVLKQPTTQLPDYWEEIAQAANQAAYQEILGALLNRGYSKAQIDAWDRGSEFNRTLGLYFALRDGGAYHTLNPQTVERLDLREDLLKVLVFDASGEPVKASGDRPGLVASAGPSAEGGIFAWPDPDSPNLGEYTKW